MGLEQRGSGSYYYRKVRRGAKVISEYVGSGFLADLASLEDDAFRLERADERKAEIALVERIRIPGIDAYNRGVTSWLEGTMANAGFRRHRRGEWRKVSTEIQVAVEPLRTVAQENVVHAVLASMTVIGKEAEAGKVIRRDLKAREEQLLLGGSSALEQVLIQRIVINELQVELIQNGLFRATSPTQRSRLDRELNSAHTRLMQAVRSLAQVRRVPNLTLVQVNAVQGIAEAP